MKLIYTSVLALLLMLPLALITNHLSFFWILFISLLPINIMHWNRKLTDLHNDQKVHEGIKVLTWPPLIFFFLMLTHNKWIELF